MSRERRWVVVVGVLVVHNVVLYVWAPRWAQWTLSAVVALGLVIWSNRTAGPRLDTGLSTEDLMAGTRLGVSVAAPLALVIAAAAAIPATRPFFVDDGYAELTGAEVAWEALVRVPLLTAAFEELAFRGVLLGALRQPLSTPVAVLVSSGLFGLWHILPTLGGERLWDVVAAVLFTTVAGAVLAMIRLGSSSLAAPIIVHGTSNGVGFVATWLATINRS